eukprot:1137357-Pelagomonas_calceolata.AAC.1
MQGLFNARYEGREEEYISQLTSINNAYIQEPCFGQNVMRSLASFCTLGEASREGGRGHHMSCIGYVLSMEQADMAWQKGGES